MERKNELTTPIIFREGRDTLAAVDDLRKHSPLWREYDIYRNQLVELFEITRPDLKGTNSYERELASFLEERVSGQDRKVRGSWVYFPWSGRLVHMLG